ncbi:MAG: hypothetical protein AAF447_04455, partial [Myxococcota bacterium]
EKLYEELSLEAEKVTKTRHPKIFIGRSNRPPWANEWSNAKRELDDLLSTARTQDGRAVQRLAELVPEYAAGKPATEEQRRGLRANAPAQAKTVSGLE